MPTLYTIGHSNRTWDDFIVLLKAYRIKHLVDVRTIPKSRWVPWFNQTSMAKALQKEKITYTHLSDLGGLRHARKDSINQGWKNSGFRGFADYMQTPQFFLGMKVLNKLIKGKKQVAIMCAEAVPWRCHRSLIADAEVVRRINVLHIMNQSSVRKHVLTSFAVVDKSKRPIVITYPKNHTSHEG